MHSSKDRKSFNLSMKELKKFAQSGDPNAQYVFGRLLEEGVGILSNKKIALNWYMKSSGNGNSKAKIALARLSNEIRFDIRLDHLLDDFNKIADSYDLEEDDCKK